MTSSAELKRLRIIAVAILRRYGLKNDMIRLIIAQDEYSFTVSAVILKYLLLSITFKYYPPKHLLFPVHGITLHIHRQVP